MTAGNIRTASLAEIREMKDRGELYHNPDAPEGPDLPDSFWENARVVYPARSKSVHLRLDPDVYDWFLRTSGGKGHITRMQAVLRAYMQAHDPDGTRDSAPETAPPDTAPPDTPGKPG